jgi:hypothetical protein
VSPDQGAPTGSGPPAVSSGTDASATTVEELHRLGEPCEFSIYVGEPALDAHPSVRKRIVCEVRPRSSAPVFRFVVLSTVGGDGIEGVTILRDDGSWTETFAPIGALNSGETKNLKIRDVNFDGYDDLSLLESFGGQMGYSGTVFWIYSPKRQRFEINEALRELQNAWVDAKTRSIFAEPQGGKCRGHAQYRLIGERLVQVSKCVWTGHLSVEGRYATMSETQPGR